MAPTSYKVQMGGWFSAAVRPRLAFEAPGDVRCGHIDHNGASDARVPGFVDYAHAARAKAGDDFVRAKLRRRLSRTSPCYFCARTNSISRFKSSSLPHAPARQALRSGRSCSWAA